MNPVRKIRNNVRRYKPLYFAVGATAVTYLVMAKRHEATAKMAQDALQFIDKKNMTDAFVDSVIK